MKRTCGNCKHARFDGHPLGNCSADVANLAHERSAGIPRVRSYAVMIERTADASRCPDWQKILQLTRVHAVHTHDKGAA